MGRRLMTSLKALRKRGSLLLHAPKTYWVIGSVLIVATGVGSYFVGTHIDTLPKTKTTQVSVVQSKSKSGKTQITYISGAACQSSQLSLGLAGAAPTGLTADGLYFKFTNTSNTTCTLDGYSSFTLKTSTGSIVSPSTSNIVHGNSFEGLSGVKDPGSSTVTIQSGESAYFAAAWDNTNSEPTYCTDPITLESVPPNNSNAVSSTFSNLFSACDPGSIEPASTVYLTAIGTLNDFGLESCPTTTTDSSGTILTCTPIPKPVVALQPITLLTTSGTSSINSQGLIEYSTVPTFTPTEASYIVNITYTPLQSSGNTTVGKTISVAICPPYPNPPPASMSCTSSGGSLNYTSESPGSFSFYGYTGANKTVQPLVQGAASWSMTITENSSKPLYQLVSN